jgi:hypothetical protein
MKKLPKLIKNILLNFILILLCIIVVNGIASFVSWENKFIDIDVFFTLRISLLYAILIGWWYSSIVDSK